MNLIIRYNDGLITREEVRQDLDRIIGGKRRVAITVSREDRSYILILPAPILLYLTTHLLRRFLRRGGGSVNAVYAEFVPGPGGPERGAGPTRLAGPTRREARAIGRSIRQDHPDRVRPSADVVKAYSGTGELAEEYAREIRRGARHWRKGVERRRIQLDFNPDTPLVDRVSGLAFVIDRYLRMTPTLMRSNIRGRRRRRRDRDYDLINVYEDREVLDVLLARIVRSDVNDRGRPERMPPPRVPENGRVRFEFYSPGFILERLFGYQRGSASSRGTAGRRQAVYEAYVQIGNRRYLLDRRELHELADSYLANHQIIRNKPTS